MHNDTSTSSMNLFLSSKYADQYVNGNPSQCVFNIRSPIVPEPNTRILMCVTDCELPYSFYIFRQNVNNHLRIHINGGSNINYTLTPGNYNINQLIDAFNSITSTLYSAGITASYDSNSNKLSFTINSGTIKVVSSHTTMLREIGFTTSQNTYATSITGDNMCDLSGLANIYLRSKNLILDNYDSNPAVSGSLCKINVDVLPLQYIFYRPVENLYVRLAQNSITSIDIEIEDEGGNIINLNGGTFSLTLSIHFQYQREPKLVDETLFHQTPTNYNKLDYEKKI